MWRSPDLPIPACVCVRAHSASSHKYHTLFTQANTGKGAHTQKKKQTASYQLINYANNMSVKLNIVPVWTHFPMGKCVQTGTILSLTDILFA